MNRSTNTSTPPADDPPQAAGSRTPATDNLVVTPVAFTPSASAPVRRLPSVWTMAGLLLVFAVALVMWFLFTSRSVQLQFTPPASSVEVVGGLSLEIGGVWLLREGDYTVLAEAANHKPLQQTIIVGQERSSTFALAFEPLPGQIAFTSTPPGALVSVDGREVGITPLMDIDVAAGEHEVAFTLERFLPTEQLLSVEGKRIQQSVEAALDPDWADVSISTRPPGALVLVDGQDTGLTTPATVEVPSGEREIALTLDGHRSHLQRVFTQAGVPMELAEVALQKADARLTVSSKPSGAGVTINGNYMGQTPVSVELESGIRQKIQIIKSGFAINEQTVSLKAAEDRRMAATLKQLTGLVNVTVTPADAELFVNGKSLGVLRDGQRDLTLPIRAHDIRLALAGHASYRTTITPRVGLTQEVRVRLLTNTQARLAAMQPRYTTKAGQTMVLFEPGPFTMGASRREPGRRANETLREVTMNRLFYLSSHEVTNAQFRMFARGHDSGKVEELDVNQDDHPVVRVSWTDAALYCNWLSDAENRPPYYVEEFGKIVGSNPASTGYRLPTEAEWSWTARHSEGKSALRFPWGENLPPPDRHGNYADRAAAHLVGRIIFGYNDNHTVTAPIGTFKPNAKGIFDMGGNVAEWTSDYYEIPGPDSVTDPTGPVTGEYRVIKGSSYMHGTITDLRYSFRDYGLDGRADLGIRLARYAE